VIRHQQRDELKQYLGDKGIETAIHYPTALPFLKAYELMGHKPSDFPVAFAETKKILSIPMFPELKNEQMAYLAETLNAFN